MHQRYNFELIENEPDVKVFRTTADYHNPDDNCWVYLVHDYNELDIDMVLETTLTPSNSFENGWWKEIVNKIKMCYKVFTNQKIQLNGKFTFRGRNHIEDFADMITLLSKEVKKETNELIEVKKQLRKEKK